MKNLTLIVTAITVALLLLIGLMTYATYSNQEVRLRSQFNARQDANRATYDNMWKTIGQSAQVTASQKQALSDIIVGNSQARAGNGPDKAVVKWIKEAVPNVDLRTFENLQNIIVSSRQSFTNDQVALLDIKREHDNLLQTFPASLIVGGRPPLVVKLVTSTRTEASFESGRDDDTQVFK